METKQCPLCDRVLTNQGFGGHMWAAHGIRVGEHAKLEDVQKRVVRLEDDLAALSKVAHLTDNMPRLEDLKALKAEIRELRDLHVRNGAKGVKNGEHTALYPK